MSKHKTNPFLDAIKTAIYAALIALVIRTFAYEPFNIPSGSMIPTLLVGDFLFVSKYSYGYSRYSLPFGLPLISGRLWLRPPERGDVAVFKLPSDTKIDYIKRIVGLPGDVIQLRHGVLHVNGTSVKRERIEDRVVRDSFGNTRRSAQYIETFANGRSHAIVEESEDGPLDSTKPYSVPEGHVFGMGDNRDNSLDSRRIGFIPIKNLVGRAEFLFFSIDGSIWEFWKWPWSIRFGRLFDGIE
ncbi:MAG: signal peptidase I [Rhodospirillales bacterium]|jgi:signal peptidase I|nr:signal peptidase I [Rhodospirillales bacterium]